MPEEIFWVIFILGYAIPMALYKDNHYLAAGLIALATTLFTITYWAVRLIAPAWKARRKEPHKMKKSSESTAQASQKSGEQSKTGCGCGGTCGNSCGGACRTTPAPQEKKGCPCGGTCRR